MRLELAPSRPVLWRFLLVVLLSASLLRPTHALAQDAKNTLNVTQNAIPKAIPNAPLILLDAGHHPQLGGALSVTGQYEVHYNDALVAKLAQALREKGFAVDLTRSPADVLSLSERVAKANQAQGEARADLFLSIHHDSTQLRYLKSISVDKISDNGEISQLETYQTTQAIQGYSVFVSKKNARFKRSARLAEALGQAMFELGRPPNLRHAEKIPGENRQLLNRRTGVYYFDNLVVLAKTEIPAVLLEIGVIVDVDDERYVRQEQHQNAICQAIVKAISAYFSAQAAPAGVGTKAGKNTS